MPVKIILPEEAERRNIITKRELQAVIVACNFALNGGRVLASRNRRDIQSAALKIQRTIDELQRAHAPNSQATDTRREKPQPLKETKSQ